MGQQWYIGYPDRTEGPFSARELAEWARSGRLRPDDRISADGTAWYLARQVKNLTFGPPPAATIEAPLEAPVEKRAVPPTGSSANGIVRLTTGSIVPGYEILDELGAGGMGVVYKARQVKLNRVVALKTVTIPPQNADRAIARFEQEALAVAKLQHPHIVAAYDYGHHEGALYFVMELLDGETLEDYVHREGRLDEATAWGLARQAASGLAHAARLGITHRDIKPANLFLVEAPTGLGLAPGLPMVKLTDFGLARFNDPAVPTDRMTAAGTVLGTPIYMAPEQFSSEDADARSDIYSLGASVYHMLAGKPPFDESETVWSVMVQKLEPARAIDLPLGTSAGTLRLVADMMAVDRQRRIASYEELIARIDELFGVSEGRSGSFAATVPDVAPRPRRRSLWPTALAGGLASGVMIAVLAVTLGLGRPSALEVPEMVLSGRIEPLYDSMTLAGWTTMSGNWRVENDDEGTPTIAGRGLIRRRLPTLENFRVSIGASLDRAKIVELQFAIAAGPTDQALRFVLQAGPEGGVRAGTRRGDQGDFEPVSEAIAFPSAEDLAGRAPYLEMSCEKRGPVWVVGFEGKTVAVLPDHGQPRVPEIRLAADGVARFDRADIDELLLPAQAGP